MPSWGKCDYKQFQAFQKRLEKLATHDFQSFCESAAKELAARLLAKVISRTPTGDKPKLEGPKTVNVQGASGKSKAFLTAEAARRDQYWGSYMGGTLRRGWTAKTEAEAQGGSGRPSANDGVAYAKSLPVVHQGNEFIIEIVNPVHYASYVEYGHRQTPGRYVPALGKRLKASWVKGRFMLTISEQELQAQSPALLEKKLIQFLAANLDIK